MKTNIEVEVYAFICGFLNITPVPFFLIRHGDLWLAFDTGNNVKVAKDPVGHWGEYFANKFNPVMKEDEEFQSQIKKLGLTVKDITLLIMSHGHMDHAGAIENFSGTNIPVYFQKRELDQITHALAAGDKSDYIPGDFKCLNELNIKTIEGVFDVFGDQRVVVFPTPGHTPGHQSLMVRLASGKMLILTQDACRALENMINSIPPPRRAGDMAHLLQGLYIFKVMNFMGAEIVPPHDPDYWKNKPLAPNVFE